MAKNKKKNENEFDPYSVDKLARVPLVLKIFVIKYWGAGAAALLVYSALNMYLPADQYGNINLDGHAVFWIVFGLVIDLFMNKLIRMMGNPTKPTMKYLFINGSSAFTIFGNIIYAAVCWIIITNSYDGVLQMIFKDSYASLGSAWSPFNPFTFAALFVVCDALLLTIKNTAKYLYNRIRFGKEDSIDEEQL